MQRPATVDTKETPKSPKIATPYMPQPMQLPQSSGKGRGSFRLHTHNMHLHRQQQMSVTGLKMDADKSQAHCQSRCTKPRLRYRESYRVGISSLAGTARMPGLWTITRLHTWPGIMRAGDETQSATQFAHALTIQDRKQFIKLYARPRLTAQ